MRYEKPRAERVQIAGELKQVQTRIWIDSAG